MIEPRLVGITKPVDLSLQHVLGDMPRKVFHSTRQPRVLEPLSLPKAKIYDHLDRVLRLLSVGSKRFLTNKVDRSVTGLIAQQSCVGPLHTPLAVRTISDKRFEEQLISMYRTLQ